MRNRLAKLLLTLLSAGLAACSGGIADPSGAVWPPELPRQPGRLTLVAPGVADPLEWWKLNLHDTLPAQIYSESWFGGLAAGIVERTNVVRSENGLESVTELPGLNRAAQAHAVDQATRDYWAHTNPEGLGSRQRVLAGMDRNVNAGWENSSIGLTGAETAEGIVHGWLTHTGHRELLLNPDVRYIGVGVFRYAGSEPVHFTQLLVDLAPDTN